MIYLRESDNDPRSISCVDSKFHWTVHGGCREYSWVLTKSLFVPGDDFIDGESGFLLSIMNVYVAGAS